MVINLFIRPKMSVFANHKKSGYESAPCEKLYVLCKYYCRRKNNDSCQYVAILLIFLWHFSFAMWSMSTAWSCLVDGQVESFFLRLQLSDTDHEIFFPVQSTLFLFGSQLKYYNSLFLFSVVVSQSCRWVFNAWWENFNFRRPRLYPIQGSWQYGCPTDTAENWTMILLALRWFFGCHGNG